MTEADPLRMKGFPMESLFVIEEEGQSILLGHYHPLSETQKKQMGLKTHREKAVEKAVTYIKELIYKVKLIWITI